MKEQILDNASANVLGDKSSTSADQNANLTNRDHNDKQNTNTENACKQNANLKTNASTKTTNTESDTSVVKKLGFLAVLFMLTSTILHLTIKRNTFGAIIIVVSYGIFFWLLYKISQIIDKNVKDLNLTKTTKCLIVCYFFLILLSASVFPVYIFTDIAENDQTFITFAQIFVAILTVISLSYSLFFFFWCKKMCKAGKTPLFWVVFLSFLLEGTLFCIDEINEINEGFSIYGSILHTLTLALAFFMFKEMEQEEKI